MGSVGSTIDEIKNRCDIVDVINRWVPLKKSGKNFKGLCPFHSEKTPSFVVSLDKQIFTCFGCGARGDVIEFIMRYHNLDFYEAIEKLASIYGINLKSFGFAQEGNKVELYEINREAASFFHKCLTRLPNEGYDYMSRRSIEPITLRRFGIGYADGDWNTLTEHLLHKGIKPSVLTDLGLISASKGKYFDKYRSRIMFPIINTRSKVIGFGGRSVANGVPKYLNSPESSVFLKKNNLYGLNLTRQDINRENCAILVEGYMDVISLYQHGIRNVSASLGTSLTEGQALMLKRYTNQILIAYDGDEAGQQAAIRASDILYKAGCNVKILDMEGESDPDDFIKENGKEQFMSLMEEAVSFIDYRLQLLKKKYQLDSVQQRVEYLKEAAQILRNLSPVESDAYIRKIAAETKISEGAIRQETYGKENKGPVTKINETQRVKDKGGNRILERNLIRLMLLKSSYIPKMEPYGDVFLNPVHYRIYKNINNLYKEDEEIDLNLLSDSLDEEENRAITDILENVFLSDKDDRIFEECIKSIHADNRSRREAEIIRLLAVLHDDSDKDAIMALTKELMEMQSGKTGESSHEF